MARRTKSAGRPTKRTDKSRASILASVGGGSSLAAAARRAGMSPETLRRWLLEDEGFRGDVARAQGAIEVRVEAEVLRTALGNPAEYDQQGHLIRSERRPNLQALIFWLTHHPNPREAWGESMKVDVNTLVQTVGAEQGLSDEELAQVMAEVDRILATEA